MEIKRRRGGGKIIGQIKRGGGEGQDCWLDEYSVEIESTYFFFQMSTTGALCTFSSLTRSYFGKHFYFFFIHFIFYQKFLASIFLISKVRI